ncbi:exonuclease subunit SbcD [Alteromonas sp. 009811495]|uniref:exonuclease subunit SbcD n=1 Tax=Alteromonas sp. 009811495 TaxID=3002962 RepID=UPI00237D61B4|nr:exonuclease subunit SbcD [Alteromonas sp. 009811495]WDT86952.1 exonuclease subunit SbcD [Alteromonas sp. 009811495]
MKILHTSDWHLGQSFFTKSRKNEHAAFLKWLLNEVEIHSVDALIVAGDVFDTGTPPSYARELYHEFIGALQTKKCTLIVLGGNHDSVSVLNESKALLKYLNSHVIASTFGDADDQVITLEDSQGNCGAILCAVPFIRPRDVIISSAGQDAVEKRQALGDAIKQHYATLFQKAVSLREASLSASDKTLPIIATGHLTALGVSQSESVRDIYIGTLEGFDASGFPPADYIALGHIHRPQKVAGKAHIRYSGSPIPLSFDELNTQKQVVLVDFDGDENGPEITTISVPRFQAMQVIKGDLTTIEQKITTSDDIANASEAQPVWLCIEVETQDYLTDLQQRIQQMLDGKHAEILQLKRVRKQQVKRLSEKQNVQLSELSVTEVFEARLELENFDDTPERMSRISNLFADAVELVNTNQEDLDSQQGVQKSIQDGGKKSVQSSELGETPENTPPEDTVSLQQTSLFFDEPEDKA